MVVILNDNGMSIDRNVGGLSKHLSRMRTDPEYYEFKKKYRKTLEKLPAGRTLYEWSHEVKSAVKKTLLPPLSTVFEEMGFSYMGPVDGHDIQRLTVVLREAREAKRPVLVHVHTVKGNGYAYALREPERFHGVPPFDPATGKVRKESGETFSHVFGETLCQLARQDDRVCAITAAMADGTGLTDFAKEFPRRFFDVGIAEGHGVAMAGGMAKQGLVPVFAVYDTFLQRGYDMLVQDLALEKLHAVLAVDRCGIVGADGETHHGCLDYLSQIPGMTVLVPASFDELRQMLRRAVEDIPGPLFYVDADSRKIVARSGDGQVVTELSWAALSLDWVSRLDLIAVPASSGTCSIYLARHTGVSSGHGNHYNFNRRHLNPQVYYLGEVSLGLVSNDVHYAIIDTCSAERAMFRVSVIQGINPADYLNIEII
jgi:1-deoxy-D-xylulose-5-phosphate synthase